MARYTENIQTTLRLPPELHQQIMAEAERREMPARSLMIEYLRRGLEQDRRRHARREDA